MSSEANGDSPGGKHQLSNDLSQLNVPLQEFNSAVNLAKMSEQLKLFEQQVSSV